MRKIIAVLFVVIGAILTHPVYAILNLELTRGLSGAVPIAIVPFSLAGQAPFQDVSEIVSNDLRNSGRFKVFGRNKLTSFPAHANEVQFGYFRGLGADNVVVGKVQQIDSNHYKVSFQLLDVFKGKDSPEAVAQSVVLEKSYVVPAYELRSLAHHISDVIFQQITGVRGVFSTRLAYILVQRESDTGPAKFTLEVADQDGYNPKPLLVSSEPIMSPAWSPNGKQIAYVSFEERHSAIYVEDVATGSRYLVSKYPGINGAPAWSPDGRKLALVLSKTGTPNIFVLDLASKQLTQLTNDFYINTEPSWSPDGRSLVFTSNRSGNPQIYQLNLATKAVTRLTYEGKYNARASFTPDGNRIVVLNQGSGMFNIGTLDLDSGIFRVLTNSGSDSQSPSMAPNGGMILYGTIYGGKSVLSMVATDGSVQLRLPTRNGEVQDPAWSPFLS